MKKEEYIDSVLKHIKNKAFASTIRQEIEGHIDDRELYYKDCGYDTETAQQKAIEHMGSAEEVGEKMNQLHKNTPALVTGIISIIVYILGLAIAAIDFNFAIISTDPSEIYFYVFLISLTSFAAGTVCYNIAYKNKFKKMMTAFGVINLIGVMSPFTFLAFGYSIAGFVFNFHSALKIPIEGIIDDPGFIGYSIGYGTDNDFCYISILVLTALFCLTPLISGIISLCSAKKMNADLSDKKSRKKSNHFKRYGTLLLVLTIIGTVTLTIETTAHCVSIIREYIPFTVSEDADADESFDLFNSIELPFSKDNLNELDSIEEYNISDAKEYGWVSTIIHQNDHYTVQLWDNDADGYYEEKRIFSSFSSKIKKTDFDKIKKGMTTEELFDIIPISQVSDYRYIVTDNGYEESIDLYADGELIKHFISANLYIVCKDGIITQLTYSPAESKVMLKDIKG